MKILLLIIKKLHGHLVENRLISVIYILSFMISVLVFTYIYNNFMPTVVRSAGTESMDHYYAFEFAREDDKEKENASSWLRSFLEEYNTYYVEYCYSMFKNSEITEQVTMINEATGEILVGTTFKDGYSEAIPNIAAYKDDIVRSVLSEGRNEFTSEEKEGNLNVAILPESTSDGGFLPKYTYEDCEYEAIGWCMGQEMKMIIPEKLFFNKGFYIDSVEIYMNDVLTASENKEFIEAICSRYDVEGIVSPEIMDDLYIKNSRQIAFMLIIGFSVMIFVFGYLIRYILTAGKNESVIYRLVGAGNKEIIAVTIIESLFINIVLSVLTMVIHALLFKSVFNELNFYSDVSLGLWDYIFIVGITTVFSFIAILPHIIKSIRYTLIKSKV